jgi:coenzyme Q-binding protein COQ10
MAKAVRTEVYEVSINKFFQAIADFKSYPQFVDGVSGMDILKEEGQHSKVKMSVNIIKSFSYVLNLKKIEPTEVSWTLDSGDLLKVNNGKWTLKDLGNNKTEVTYSLEIEVKGFLPGLGLIEKTLVNTNLPLTMKAFAKRAQTL